MKFVIAFTVSLAVFCSTLLEQAESSDECHEFLKTMLMSQMKFVVPCINKLGLTTPEQKKKELLCIMRCVIIDAKLLGADGNMDADLLSNLIDQVPPSVRDKATKIVTECGGLAGSLEEKDSCASYGPLLTCITDIGVKMC